MDIVTRFDRILKLQQELVKETALLEKEQGITLCSVSNSLHIYKGIEKIEQAYDLKAKFVVEDNGRMAYKRINREGVEVFQIGYIKDAQESSFDFLKAEKGAENEDNE